ncbi:uncharacterized protein LOC134771623 [Penaeus indicus]|uniref:uncharacterized protein LOC134771623 n=1 Tax=Penaeus indicus TaxID=29960 RepID=UPI00300C6B46
MVNQGDKKQVPADDYYHAEEKLYTSIVESANTAMSLIIDKYICLANGLPAPDADIEECFGGRNKKKQSLVKYLEDHEPNEMTFSQTRKLSPKPQPALPPKSCTEEDIQREVQETLQRRKSQLGLPDDYDVREVQDTEVDLESDSDLSEVEDEDIKDVVSSKQVKGWRRKGNRAERKKETLKGETQTQSRTVRRNRFCSSLNEEVLFKNAYKNDEESRENVLKEPAVNEKTQSHVSGGTTSSKTHRTQITNVEKEKEKSTSEPEKICTNGPLASVLPEELDHGALLVTDMLDTVFIPPFTSQEREKTLMKIEQKLGKHVVAFHFSYLGGKDIDAQGEDSYRDIRETTTCLTMKDADLETQTKQTTKTSGKTSRYHESANQTEKDTHNEKDKTVRNKKKEKTVPAAKATACHTVCDPKTSDAHSDGRTRKRNVQNTSKEKSSGEERVDNLPQERRRSRRISALSSQLTEKSRETPEQHEPPSERGETTHPSPDTIGKNTQPSSEDHQKRRRGRPKSKSHVVTSSTVPETDIKMRKRSISDQVPRQLRNSLENIFHSEEEKLEEKARYKEQELAMVPSVPEFLQPLKEDMQAVNEVASKKRNDKNFSRENVNACLASSDKENNPLFVNSENIPNLTSTSIDNETEPHLDSKRQRPKIRRVLLSNGRIVFKYKMDSEKEICSQDLPPEGVKNNSEITINERQRTGSILGNIPGNLWQQKMWHSKQEESIIAGIDPVKKKRKSLSMGHKPIGHKASDSMLLKWSSMIARNSTVELSSIVEDSTFSVIHPMGKMNDRARKQEGWGPGAVPEHSTQEAMRGMQQNPQKFAKPQAFPHDSQKVNRRNAEESLREAEQSKLLQLYNVKKPVTSLTDQMEQSSSSDEETTLLTVERSSRVVGPFHSSLTTVIKLREQFRDTSDQTVQVNRPTAVSAADSNLQNESAVRRTTKSFWELDDSDDSLPSETFKAPSCPKPQGPKREHKQITSMEQSSHAYSILGNVKWHKRKDEKKLDSKKPRLLLANSSLRMGKDHMK